MYKYIFALALLIGVFGGGYYLGRGKREVITVEKTGETHTVYRDRIVTVMKTVHPDGTVTEITKTEDKSGGTDSITHDKSNQTRSLASNYSIGLKYWQRYADGIVPAPRDLGRYEAVVGRRIIGDMWVDLGVRKEEAALGVRLEF